MYRERKQCKEENIMNLPSILGNVGQMLQNAGDYMKMERTQTDRLVATARLGDVKFSKTLYPSTNRVVETKSYTLSK